MTATRPRIEVVAFDADDTLWHCESLFQETQARLSEILEHYAPHDDVQTRLHATERRNVQLFGYGVKGFTLSMVETAIEISGHRVSASELHEIVMMGKAMLDAPLELMDGIDTVLATLAHEHRLFLISKGDLLDQRNKIEKSGLAHRFEHVEIVPEKEAAAYRAVFAQRGVTPAAAMMVGNSLRSDALPMLEIGGHAVHIPYHVTAEFERHGEVPRHPNLHCLERVTELPALLRRLGGAASD
jgi:putative hydrolase of the HAD superfamily